MCFRCWRDSLSGLVRVLAFLPIVSSSLGLQCPAATLWTGPNTNWTKSAATPSDTILAGRVVLTRGSRDVLYNTAAGETAAGISSPKDTLWAFGDISNFDRLTYQTMESLRNGNLAARILNQPMVVHLTNEDIYLSIRFTTWGQFGSGTVAYTRSTPSGSTPPTVNITSPAAGAVFAAPANVTMAANATVSGATVTNVTFYKDGTLLGTVLSAPFRFTATGLEAGAYSLTAVAMASGLAATSAPVSITIVSPVAVSLTPPGINGGKFSFSYSANPGLSYVVQASSDLSEWVSVRTNVASGSPVLFSESLTPGLSRYYRVGRLPNP